MKRKTYTFEEFEEICRAALNGSCVCIFASEYQPLSNFDLSAMLHVEYDNVTMIKAPGVDLKIYFRNGHNSLLFSKVRRIKDSELKPEYESERLFDIICESVERDNGEICHTISLRPRDAKELL